MEDAEDLLRRSRPQPRPEFVAELEEVLLRSVEPRRARARRFPTLHHPPRLLAASGFAAALVALLITLSVAGALPLSVGGADDAEADRNCTTTTRWTVERRAVLEVGADKKMHVRDRSTLVPRRVQSCH